MTRFNPFRVASGWDQTLTDDDNIEAITNSDAEPKHIPGIGDVVLYVGADNAYSRGNRVFTLAGAKYDGRPQQVLTTPRADSEALESARDLEGQVTAQIPAKEGGTLGTFNCYLTIDSRRVDVFDHEITWVFDIVEDITPE